MKQSKTAEMYEYNKYGIVLPPEGAKVPNIKQKAFGNLSYRSYDCKRYSRTP